MKKIIYSIIVVSSFAFSQNKTTKEGFNFEPVFRLNVVKNNQFGDNFLAKANQPDLGIGMELSILGYKNFSTTFDFNYNYFSVSNVEKAGNINSTRYNSVGVKVLYEVDVYNKFSIQPYLGIGNPTLNFKSGSQSFGKQNGIDYKLGFYVNYNLKKHFALCFGTEYNWANYTIETTPELVDFYKKSNAIKLSLGIRLQ